MKITKFEHSCMLIEQGNTKIVIDPGMFIKIDDNFTGIKAVIITHLHGDHFVLENIQKIVKLNSSVVVFAVNDVLSELNGVDCQKIEVTSDIQKLIGEVKLDLKLDDHAPIYGPSPCKNIRVFVNDDLYYPGDCLVGPERPILAVALPLSAPWSKAAETIEYIKLLDTKIIFPVHDAVLSEEGKGFYNTWMQKNVNQDVRYKILSVGESLTI